MSRPPVVFAAFPFQQEEYTHGGTIRCLPLAASGLDNVYSMLITSDDLQPKPRYFGSIRRERQSLLAPLHLFLSTAISHQGNTADPEPGYEHRAPAQLIYRTYMPDPEDPSTFAILLQCVVGARAVLLHPSEPNVSKMDAPQRSNGADGIGEENGEHDDAHGFEALLAEEGRREASGPQDAKKPSTAARKASIIAVYDMAWYAGALFDDVRRRRLELALNSDQLLPMRRASEGPWDLLTLVDRMDEAMYLRSVMQELRVLSRNNTEWTARAVREPLDNDSIEIMQRHTVANAFDFQDWTRVNRLRATLSLPNSLRLLRDWLESKRTARSDLSQHESWTDITQYFDIVQKAHATPRGCVTFVVPVVCNKPALRRFLYTQLPQARGARDLLEHADVQLALLHHPQRSQQLAVYEAVTRLGLDHDGTLWFSALHRRLQRLSAQEGVRAEMALRSDVELTSYVLTEIYHERRIASEVGLLYKQAQLEASSLLEGGLNNARDWEVRRLQQKALQDLLALQASGQDDNVILQSSCRYFEDNVLEGGELRACDIAADLANYRSCFASYAFDDLTDTSALLAKFGIAIRAITGLITYWREDILILLVAFSSFLDQGGRTHVLLKGDPGAGKTKMVNSVVEIMPDIFCRSHVHESEAAMRDPNISRDKNTVELQPEAGIMGDHKDAKNRAVDLSRKSESSTESRHIDMIDNGPNKGRERKLVTTRSYHAFSSITASNLGIEDDAFVSRCMVLGVMPISSNGRRFGEAGVLMQELQPLRDPCAESFRRGFHFFSRCVAAVCMLINAGVIDVPPNQLNVAIINRIMPNTTDSSHVRLFSMLYKLARVLDIWAVVHKFLASPYSPLTLIHGDRLSMEALIDVRALMQPSCGTGIFISSCSPFLGDNVLMRRVIDSLLRTVLMPSHASSTEELDAYKQAVRGIVSTDKRERESELRKIHLDFLPRLFPPPPAIVRDADDRRAFFSLDMLGSHAKADVPVIATDGVSQVTRSTGVSRQDAQRALDEMADMFVPDDEDRAGPSVPRKRTRISAQDRDLREEGAPAGVMRQSTLHESMARASASEPLLEADRERALHRLADYMMQVMRRMYAGAQEGRGAQYGAHGRKTGRAEQALRDDIRLILQKLQVVPYPNGVVSLDSQMLQRDDEGRVKRELKNLVDTFDVPAGTYVTYHLRNPDGNERAEALDVIVSPDKPDRKSFDELLNQDQGRATALHQIQVALQLGSSDVDQARIDELEAYMKPDLRPGNWWRDARKHMIGRSGLGLGNRLFMGRAESVLAPLVVRGQPLRGRELVLRYVGALFCEYTAPRDASIQEEYAVALERSGVGRWEKSRIVRRPAVPYHAFETRRLPAPAARPEASVSPAPSTSHSSNNGKRMRDDESSI